MEANETFTEGHSKAQKEIQQKIADAKAIAKRRETMLLNRSSLYGSLSSSHAPVGKTYWEDNDDDDDESDQHDSMGDIAQATILHEMPEYQRQKEAENIKNENKEITSRDKNIDLNIDDIFHEQHRSAVTKMIDDISNLEQGEKKKENEGYDKSKKKKCIIS